MSNPETLNIENILRDNNPEPPNALLVHKLLQTLLYKYQEDPKSDLGQVNEVVINGIVTKIAKDVLTRYYKKGFPALVIISALGEAYLNMVNYLIREVEVGNNQAPRNNMTNEQVMEDSILKLLSALDNLKQSIINNHGKYLSDDVKK